MSTAITQSLSAQTLLLLDASTLIVQTGILRDGAWLAYCENENESLNAIFKGSAECLKKAQCEFDAIDGFLLCEGPGSVLGLRLALMAVKTWRSLPSHRQSKVYLYRSLEVAAAMLSKQKAKPPFHLICDFKKDQWNLLTVRKDHRSQKMKQAPAQYLKNLTGPVWYIRQRKNAHLPPFQVKKFKYSLKTLPALLDQPQLFHSDHDLSQINPGKSEFAKWQAQRHRKTTA